jgi:CheY-like chemotaxis protein
MTNKIALIVEDDTINLQIMQDILTSHGFTVVTAVSLRDAQRQAELQERLDLALLDLNLPDGLSTALMPGLKAKFPNIMVIVMSSANPEEVEAILQEYPVDKFLSKPFDPQWLLKEVLRFDL